MGVWLRKVQNKNGSTTKTWYGTVFLPSDNRYPGGRIKYGRRSFAIGEAKDMSRREAVARYDEIKQTILKEHEAENADSVTISQFEPEYLRYTKEISKKKTIRDDIFALRNVKRILGADTYLENIKEPDLIRYQLTRLEDGVKNATVNRELAVFRHFINVAIASGKFAGPNPFTRKFKMLKAADNRERILTPDEERKLYKHLPPHQWVIVDFALNTACRAGEIVSLKWEYVDLKKRLITIPKVNTKRELSVKVIDINPHLHKVLTKHHAVTGKHEYVFLSPQYENYKSVLSWKFFPRACKKLGIKGVTFHTLRHTAITRMLGENQPLDSVARIAGHRSVTTTQLYAHRNPADKRAVNALVKYRKG